jgi:hypothetical protein
MGACVEKGLLGVGEWVGAVGKGGMCWGMLAVEKLVCVPRVALHSIPAARLKSCD